MVDGDAQLGTTVGDLDVVLAADHREREVVTAGVCTPIGVEQHRLAFVRT